MSALLATRHALGYFTVGMTAILGVETVPERRLRLAMAELDAAEQVIQAAREAVEKGHEHIVRDCSESYDPWVDSIEALHDRLAVFDAAHKEET